MPPQLLSLLMLLRGVYLSMFWSRLQCSKIFVCLFLSFRFSTPAIPVIFQTMNLEIALMFRIFQPHLLSSHFRLAISINLFLLYLITSLGVFSLLKGPSKSSVSLVILPSYFIKPPFYSSHITLLYSHAVIFH